MKALATALVLCTLILCGSIFALPFLIRQRELALEERIQAHAEREIVIQFVAPQPEPLPEVPHGQTQL